jgi:hypothetical protein
MRIRWRSEFQAEFITPNILLPKFLFSQVYNNNTYYYFFLLLLLTLLLRSVGCNLKQPQRRHVCLAGTEISVSHTVLFICCYEK